jgi:hypothetical protein
MQRKRKRKEEEATKTQTRPQSQPRSWAKEVMHPNRNKLSSSCETAYPSMTQPGHKMSEGSHSEHPIGHLSPNFNHSRPGPRCEVILQREADGRSRSSLELIGCQVVSQIISTKRQEDQILELVRDHLQSQVMSSPTLLATHPASGFISAGYGAVPIVPSSPHPFQWSKAKV